MKTTRNSTLSARRETGASTFADASPPLAIPLPAVVRHAAPTSLAIARVAAVEQRSIAHAVVGHRRHVAVPGVGSAQRHFTPRLTIPLPHVVEPPVRRSASSA